MPFKSKAQEKFMFSEHPDIALRWARKRPLKRLPQKVSKKSSYQGMLKGKKDA